MQQMDRIDRTLWTKMDNVTLSNKVITDYTYSSMRKKTLKQHRNIEAIFDFTVVKTWIFKKSFCFFSCLLMHVQRTTTINS